MKRILIIVTLILAAVVVFGQTAEDQNYKLGNFNMTQVKAKSVNVGGSWTVQKNSTSKYLDIYYGATLITSIPTTVEGMRDTASFTTTATRAAVYIAGATANDIYVVAIKGNTTALDYVPVAGDLLSWRAKADSLIVNRAAGTTSGLTFSYIRFK